MQTIIDEYKYIEKQIERSKIKRYPYKEYLGESLTSYCNKCFYMGLNTSQVLGLILKEVGIKNLIFDYGVKEEFNILKNLNISVCARYTEYKRYNTKW
jgi:hypothetical protein